MMAEAESSRAPTIVDTQPMPTTASEPPLEDDGKKTMIMNAVDQETLSQLTRDPDNLEAIVRTTGEHPIVDDGQRTVAMQAVDPAALGLEVASSGTFPAASDDDEGGEEDPEANGNGNGNGNGGEKKKFKKRKKRR
jgi:hypothetical protein